MLVFHRRASHRRGGVEMLESAEPLVLAVSPGFAGPL
jgi:hypothetical protein